MQIDAVYRTASATAEHVGIKGGLDRGRIMANGDYVGPGYGIPTAGTIEAIRLAALHEGLLLDPVYTGKAMKGLIALSNRGDFDGETVVFLHTGGAQGLFGYQSELEGKL